MIWQVFFISSGNKSSDGGRCRGCLVLKGWGESAHLIFMLPCMRHIRLQTVKCFSRMK